MPPLKNLLLEKISEKGGISVAEYMALCLRHPQFGYYATRDPFGADGDFITSPEISQLFGEMLGIWAISVLQQMGPKNPALVELGPGRGTMMADILRLLRKYEIYDSVSVHMVEISPVLSAIQRENLRPHIKKITWHKSIATLPSSPMVILANEFFDALPVRQFAGENEVMIHAKNGEFYFSGADGEISEISPESLEIIETLAEKITAHGGAMLIVDYGYEKSNGKSSLQAVKNHKFHDFLVLPGEADLTAHVDFSALKKSAEKSGALVKGAISQNQFLENMGIRTRAENLKKNTSEEQRGKIDSALARLLDSEQMGELFKALAIFSLDIPEVPGF